MKQVEINCTATEFLPHHVIKPLQGDLKNLSGDNYQKLKAQILKYGFTSPIHVWVSPDGLPYALDGHQRLRTITAMANEGFSVPDLPVTHIEAETEKDAKKILLSLASQYGEMQTQGFMEFVSDLDFGTLSEIEDAFRFPEIKFDQIADEYLKDHTDKTEIEDDAPEPPKDPISKLGDLYEIGAHRLLCGDSTDPLVVEALMDGERADIVFTDPPYGINCVNEKGHIGGGQGVTKFKKVMNDDKEFDASFLIGLADKHIIWGGNYFAHKLPKSGRWLVWDKLRGEGLTLSDCELAWTDIDGVIVRKYAVQWDGFRRVEREQERIHQNQKPIQLLTRIFDDVKFESCLDLFGGSGSTLIACEKTKRRCFMMELDPHYIDVIVTRWCKYTGVTEIKKNGQPITWTIND